MEIQIGAAKVNKYATSESGDTLEVIERPNGGLSVVLADGQRSGKSAKRISNIVVRKVIALLAEGVRDGAAARAASDYLYAQRDGKVQSTLNILSIDLVSKTLVISRNNPAPVLLVRQGELEVLDEESRSVGVHRNTKPVIKEIDLVEGLTVVTYTDGLVHAGDRKGKRFDAAAAILEMVDLYTSAQHIADELVAEALKLDDGRPVDDISVVVLQVLPHEGDAVRRLMLRLPLMI